ncbi:MAG: endo-1,4-beta-xylanase [Pseudomonadales bacterium]
MKRRDFLRRLSGSAAFGLVAGSVGSVAAGLDANAHTAYQGMADSASWRRAALTRIEATRKGNFQLHISDAAGAPLKNARVRASLYRHDFGFGAAVRLAWLLDTKHPDEVRQRYQEICSSNFHKLTAANELKWKHNARNEPYLAPFFDWCQTHHLPVRGHCLVWAGFDRVPRELAQHKNDPKKLRKLIARHVRDMAARYKEPVTEWDVLNEPFSEHDFMDILGKDAALDWFHIAAEANPDAKRYINDYGVLTRSSKKHQDFYYDYIKWLLDKGAPVQGIGFQAHGPARFQPTPPEAMLATMDRFKRLGLEQQVTEFDFETDNEELQARYTQDFLIAVFSHPSMTGLVTWTPFEYGDKVVSKPSAALYNRRLMPKPNALAWNELVNGAWSTDASISTDENGAAAFRGFKGAYKVEVTAGSRTETYLVPLASADVRAQINLD